MEGAPPRFYKPSRYTRSTIAPHRNLRLTPNALHHRFSTINNKVLDVLPHMHKVEFIEMKRYIRSTA